MSDGRWSSLLMAKKGVDGLTRREANSWRSWRQVQELRRAKGAAEREDLWRGELIHGCCWGSLGVRQ